MKNTVLQTSCRRFTIFVSFTLDSREALYKLSLEIQTPLDMVILRSPAALELKESDLGTTVVSVVPPEYLVDAADSSVDGNPNQAKFVAAYRCQNGEKRLNISLRPTEGHHGDLTVIIVACCSPKAAKVMKFALKPLSLHTKVHELTDEQAARKRCRVHFSGAISLAQAHEWIQFLLPEVPPRLNDDASSAQFFFVNVFTGAVTTAEVRKNEVTLESESVSTVSIAKETIARLATQRRLRLDEQFVVEDECVANYLIKLWPRLTYQLSLAKKMELIDSLQVSLNRCPNKKKKRRK